MLNPNVEDDDQWSPNAINIRNKRFDDVIETVNDILMTKNTELKYIGFKSHTITKISYDFGYPEINPTR